MEKLEKESREKKLRRRRMTAPGRLWNCTDQSQSRQLSGGFSDVCFHFRHIWGLLRGREINCLPPDLRALIRTNCSVRGQSESERESCTQVLQEMENEGPICAGGRTSQDGSPAGMGAEICLSVFRSNDLTLKYATEPRKSVWWIAWLFLQNQYRAISNLLVFCYRLGRLQRENWAEASGRFLTWILTKDLHWQLSVIFYCPGCDSSPSSGAAEWNKNHLPAIDLNIILSEQQVQETSVVFAKGPAVGEKSFTHNIRSKIIHYKWNIKGLKCIFPWEKPRSSDYSMCVFSGGPENYQAKYQFISLCCCCGVCFLIWISMTEHVSNHNFKKIS